MMKAILKDISGCYDYDMLRSANPFLSIATIKYWFVQLAEHQSSMQTMAVGISWMRHQTDMETVSKATKDGASQQPEQEAIKRELGERYYLFSLSFTILPSVASEHVEIAWT
jgi:hypothetical protein